MLSLAVYTLLIAAVALSAGVVGLVSAPIQLFASLALTALACMAPARDGREAPRYHLLIAGVPALAAGLVAMGFHPDERTWRLLSLATILAAIGLVFAACGRPRKSFFPAAVTAFAAGIGSLLLLYSPLAWNFWLHLSLGVSSLAGHLLLRPLLLGPTYSGLEAAAVLALAIFSARLFGAQVTRRRLLFAFGWLALIEIVYLVSMTFAPATDLTAPGPDGQSHMDFATMLKYRYAPWNRPLLLLLAQLPALWIAGRGTAGPVSKPRPVWTASVAALVVVGAAVLVIRPVERAVSSQDCAGPPPRVVFYDHNKAAASWTSPDNQTFGLMSAGMLGRLPTFLRQNRFDLIRTGTIEDNDLAGTSTFVILNPLEPFDPADVARLYQFVERGGSLLVIGEHTWVSDKGEDIFPALMAPTDIRINFDSAYYHIGGWIDSCEYFPDPLWSGMRQDFMQCGVGIGASLSIGWDAEPLLVGTHAFSDIGSHTPRGQFGYLGNSLYDTGEQLGDIVLAAEQRIGKGRVVVLGDTTAFFNVLMIGSHQSVSRLFAKCAAPPVERRHLLRLLVAIVLLGGAIVLFAYSPGKSAAVVFAGLVVLGLVQWRGAIEAAGNDPVARRRVAIVDASHAEAFSRDTWRDASLAGLYLNLMRNDVEPLVYYDWSPRALSGARMLFIVAPLRTFSASEVADVERFIAAGGYVVVAIDPDQQETVAPLLEKRHLVVRNIPLGPFTPGYVQFWCAWVIGGQVPVPDVRADYGSGSTPTIVEKLAPPDPVTHRRGGLLLIADGQLLFNKNVEPEKSNPVMPNVNFIQWMVHNVDSLDNGVAR